MEAAGPVDGLPRMDDRVDGGAERCVVVEELYRMGNGGVQLVLQARACEADDVEAVHQLLEGAPLDAADLALERVDHVVRHVRHDLLALGEDLLDRRRGEVDAQPHAHLEDGAIHACLLHLEPGERREGDLALVGVLREARGIDDARHPIQNDRDPSRHAQVVGRTDACLGGG